MLDRIGRIDSQAAALRNSAGTGTVAGNLTGALTDLFGSVAVATVVIAGHMVGAILGAALLTAAGAGVGSLIRSQLAGAIGIFAWGS